MSSLRISHQNRVIALPAGGDTGRSEHADDSAAFALALGAAAGVVTKDAPVSFGGQSGDAPDNSFESRKRTDNQTKSNDAGGVVSGIAGSLVAAASIADTSPAPVSADAAAIAGAVVAAPLSGATPLATAAQAIAGKSGIFDRNGSVRSDPSAIPTAEPESRSPLSVMATPYTAAAAVTTGTPTVVSTSGSSASALVGTASTPSPALPGQDQIAADPAGLMVTDPTAPRLAASDQRLPTSVIAPNGIVVAGGSPDLATFGAAVDSTGVPASSTSAAPSGPSSDATREVANLPTDALTLSAALDIGQSATADSGNPFASPPRGRFTPIVATPDAGEAAAANAPGGNIVALSTSSATTAPGFNPDPTGTGTIADQVAGQIARMVSNGSREVVMRLHPPELGDLTVRVAVSGRDVSAWFTSPQPQVQTAISAALGQLQTNLGSAGYNLNGAWVGADNSGARQQSWSGSSSSSQSSVPLAVAAAAPAATVSRPASSGLNIYV